jgi:hypothetical protein
LEKFLFVGGATCKSHSGVNVQTRVAKMCVCVCERERERERVREWESDGRLVLCSPIDRADIYGKTMIDFWH